MATYSTINELRSIEFHDSFLNRICTEDNSLHMVFTDAIIIGQSRLDIPGRIPCTVNAGEDRYALPELKVTLKGFTIHSVLRGGCWTRDADGNTIEKYPPRNLLPEEYDAFMQMVFAEENNLVYGITFDSESNRYTLSFFMTWMQITTRSSLPPILQLLSLMHSAKMPGIWTANGETAAIHKNRPASHPGKWA